jgi:hypothetical protein
MMPGMNEPATSMAFGTGLDLNFVGTVHVGETIVRHSLPTLIRFGHFNVLPTGSVTRFAGNGHLGIRSAELSCFWIISFAQVGRVTVCAHMVPVLHGTSPKEWVVGLDVLVGINVIPSFAFDIPASGQDLHPTVGELNEILLERFPSEGVLNLKDFHFSVLVFRFHHVLFTLPKKTGNDTVTLEGSVVEIPTDGFRRRQLHGMEVMRPFPFFVLLRVALNTARDTYIFVETRISNRGKFTDSGFSIGILPARGKQTQCTPERGNRK